MSECIHLKKRVKRFEFRFYVIFYRWPCMSIKRLSIFHSPPINILPLQSISFPSNQYPSPPRSNRLPALQRFSPKDPFHLCTCHIMEASLTFHSTSLKARTGWHRWTDSIEPLQTELSINDPAFVQLNPSGMSNSNVNRAHSVYLVQSVNEKKKQKLK